ncbi:hypothetical protein AGMMS50267_00690 [Spirochaetia bacterium]|nr:hypothetical protein AGMMS50267_00690 [Spirochaetia bacterium]
MKAKRFLATAEILLVCMAVGAFFAACTHTESPSAGEYAITFAPSGNGTVTADREKAADGAVVTLSITADAGYALAAISAAASSGAVTLEGSGTTRTFTMPAGPVTVTAVFEADGAYTQAVSIFSASHLTGTPNVVSGQNTGQISYNAADEGRHGGVGAIKITPTEGSYYQFTITRNPKINLAAVNALSFWVKSPDGVILDTVGFGDVAGDVDYRVRYRGEDNLSGIAVGTEWQQIIVPLPGNPASEISGAFFLSAGIANIKDKTLYIDDIEYVTTVVTLQSITIPAAAEPIAAAPETTPAAALTSGMKGVYSAAGKTVTLVKGNAALENWYTGVTYTVSGAVTEAGGVLTPGTVGAAFTLAVSFGGKTSNTLSSTISTQVFFLIDDFEDATAPSTTATSGDNRFTGYARNALSGNWQNTTWRSTEQPQAGNYSGKLQYGNYAPNEAGSGILMTGATRRKLPIYNLTGFTKITFWFKTLRAETKYFFVLRDTAAPVGEYNQEFTGQVTAAGEWVKVELPISAFVKGVNGIPLDPEEPFLADGAYVTSGNSSGWGVYVHTAPPEVEGEKAAGSIWIDTIKAE